MERDEPETSRLAEGSAALERGRRVASRPQPLVEGPSKGWIRTAAKEATKGQSVIFSVHLHLSTCTYRNRRKTHYVLFLTFGMYFLIIYVFFKTPGALGSHLRFWTTTLTGLNADEAARVVSKRAILRHSHHTHAHTHASAPVEKSRAE